MKESDSGSTANAGPEVTLEVAVSGGPVLRESWSLRPRILLTFDQKMPILMQDFGMPGLTASQSEGSESGATMNIELQFNAGIDLSF